MAYFKKKIKKKEKYGFKKGGAVKMAKDEDLDAEFWLWWKSLTPYDQEMLKGVWDG